MPTSIPGLQQVTTLTFDIFGTVLDLTGSITPPSRRFLERKGAAVSAEGSGTSGGRGSGSSSTRTA